MGNYSNDPASVRVDFFKPSGKWYATEAITWTGGGTGVLIHDAFRKSLEDSIGDKYTGLDAVCLEPYHEYSHPIMIKNIG